MLLGPLRRFVLVVAMGPGEWASGRGAGAPTRARGQAAFLCSLMGCLLAQIPLLISPAASSIGVQVLQALLAAVVRSSGADEGMRACTLKKQFGLHDRQGACLERKLLSTNPRCLGTALKLYSNLLWSTERQGAQNNNRWAGCQTRPLSSPHTPVLPSYARALSRLSLAHFSVRK